ncbi:MAG: GNAT family N-acetyltransferase [Bacteroidia bacterium]
MVIKNLASTTGAEVVSCFLGAFANYFAPLSQDEHYWLRRWEGASIDWELSFGAFHQKKLVGFVLHGIGLCQQKKTTFNIGTGVLPAFRGQRIVQQLYDYGLPLLKVKGLEQAGLEVITENTIAIKAYQKVGFEIQRELRCFSGMPQGFMLHNGWQKEIEVHTPIQPKWEAYQKLVDYSFSWENKRAAMEILKEDFSFFELYEYDKLAAYSVFNIQNGYIAQFGMENKAAGHALLKHLSQKMSMMRINNVDATSTTMIQFWESVGMKNVLNQYEMKMRL